MQSSNVQRAKESKILWEHIKQINQEVRKENL